MIKVLTDEQVARWMARRERNKTVNLSEAAVGSTAPVERNATAMTDDEAVAMFEKFHGTHDSLDMIEFCEAEERVLELAKRALGEDQAAKARDNEWCYAEDCEYRNWRSGSVPTHKRGANCPVIGEGAGERAKRFVETQGKSILDGPPRKAPANYIADITKPRPVVGGLLEKEETK